jgi:DNA-binding IclR family transcriptional regulator
MWTVLWQDRGMSTPRGAQVVSRVTAVLRCVSGAGGTGITTTEAAAATGLSRPTVHRLLSALESDGLLDRDNASGRWLVGPELFLMGNVAAQRFDSVALARPILTRLSEQTGESTFLSVRRGNETVCVLAIEGTFPLRSHVLHEGIRFPLGVASAGLVLLAMLETSWVDTYLTTTDLVTAWGRAHSAGPLRRRLATTRRAGYSVNPGLLVEGSWGMGAAVIPATGADPAWAVSITGVSSRFRRDRRGELGKDLQAAAHRLSRILP